MSRAREIADRDLAGTELILDADNDTSITADTDDTINFKVGGSDRFTINSSGDIDVETGDMFFSTSGKGVNLGVTSNTDANTIDDYEEGTWDITASNTPNLTFEDSSSFGVGNYVKIGRFFWGSVAARVDALSGSNWVSFSLPFTGANDPTGGQNDPAGYAWCTLADVGDVGACWYWPGSANYCQIYVVNDNASDSLLTNSGLAVNDEFYFQVCGFTAS